MERNGREVSGALKNAVFYEEKPLLREMPDKWFLFAEASAGGIKDPVAFTFSLKGVQEMGGERRNHTTYQRRVGPL